MEIWSADVRSRSHWETPEEDWETPEEGWETPEEGWETPEEGWQTPAELTSLCSVKDSILILTFLSF